MTTGVDRRNISAPPFVDQESKAQKPASADGKASSRSSSIDCGLAPNEKNQRSGSYSSVREIRDALPQSFVISARRHASPSGLSSSFADDDDCYYGLEDESAVISAPLTRVPTNELPSSNNPEVSRANLGQLPAEILERIFSHLMLDVPPEVWLPRNADLMSTLRTCRSMSRATVLVLYRHASFTQSHAFYKFRKQIKRNPDLGRLVRRLDFSHFSSLGLNRTRAANAEIRNLTSKKLRRCLERTPLVREVLLQEHVDQDVDAYVLKQLLYGCPRLEALDLTGCTTANFADGFSTAVSNLRADPTLRIPALRRLCLHKCSSLRAEDLTLLLSRAPNLEVLDLQQTRITDDALAAIPASAHLTHLNLSRCAGLTAEGAVRFLLEHPAARDLVWLNLACDPSRWKLLTSDADVRRLVDGLPTSLRSLNLNGARVTTACLPGLRRLVAEGGLEELGLAGSDLTLAEVAGAGFFKHEEASASADGRKTGGRVQLRYLDLAGIQGLTQPGLSQLAEELLGDASRPLEVLEVGPKLAAQLNKCTRHNESLGWCVKELGRRSWYVRKRPEAQVKRWGWQAKEEEAEDDGSREWKMGSRWWGMRKAPVAWSEVGGLYGHYMFKA